MTTYHYYPKLNKLVKHSPAYEYMTVGRPESRPSTPPSLTHSPSSTPPSSPILRPVVVPSTMARTMHVGFKPEVRSRRQPREDELSVMRAYARHASHCEKCCSPYQTWLRGEQLCERGRGYARDVTTYIYSKGGVPHSMIDKNRFDERVEIEVPLECDVVRGLIKAFHKGLSIQSSRRPVVSQEKTTTTAVIPSRRNTVHIWDERGHGVEITPASSRPSSRPERERYTSNSGQTVANVTEIRPASALVKKARRGSLYYKDEEARHSSRSKWDADPVIILADGRNRKRAVYIR